MIACLTRLQAVTEVYWKGEDGAKLALAVFIDELTKHDPRVVRFACEQWGRKNRKFPYLAQLLEYISANAAEPEHPLVTGPEAAGAVARTEAILLLSSYIGRAKGLLGDHTRAYREFIAEAARLWSKVRPEGGLAEIDQSRGMRRVVGFALEGWARSYVGDQPLNVDYLSDSVQRMHRDMTGDDLLSVGTPAIARPPAAAIHQAINRMPNHYGQGAEK